MTTPASRDSKCPPVKSPSPSDSSVNLGGSLPIDALGTEILHSSSGSNTIYRIRLSQDMLAGLDSGSTRLDTPLLGSHQGSVRIVPLSETIVTKPPDYRVEVTDQIQVTRWPHVYDWKCRRYRGMITFHVSATTRLPKGFKVCLEGAPPSAVLEEASLGATRLPIDKGADLWEIMVPESVSLSLNLERAATLALTWANPQNTYLGVTVRIFADSPNSG